MNQDISLLNQFLLALSETKRFTPSEYFAYASVRMNALGYTFERPSQTQLQSDFADIYLLMDQWSDAMDPEENQLEKRLGEKLYLNLVWHDNGLEIAAQVVPESEIESDEYGDSLAVPDIYGLDVVQGNAY